MTIEELLKEAETLLEEASIIDAKTEIPLEVHSRKGNELAVVHFARTQSSTYLALKSLAYSQLAQAKMQYEAHVPWRGRKLP